MKLLFKQRLFSWFDSYDIYDEYGNTVYTVKGQLSWGHMFKIYNAVGQEVGTVKQKIFTLLPKFELYFGERYAGSINREFTFFKPTYNIDFMGWTVQGNLFEWDYEIFDRNNICQATVSKELFNFTDTYSIYIENPANALYALMLVLAIDAEKCSRD
jgi:uncharacterized protein YxjI